MSRAGLQQVKTKAVWRTFLAQIAPLCTVSFQPTSAHSTTPFTINNNRCSHPTPLNLAHNNPAPVRLWPRGGCACQNARTMSTGGISRKDHLWAIREEQRKQSDEEHGANQRKAEERAGDTPFSVLLSEAGYADVQEALQRVLIGAYQLLQDGQVDQAEYLVAEGAPPPPNRIRYTETSYAATTILDLWACHWASAKNFDVLQVQRRLSHRCRLMMVC